MKQVKIQERTFKELELAPRQQSIRLLALGQMCKGDHTKAYGCNVTFMAST